MKLSDLMMQLESFEQQIAVFDELMSYLDKAFVGELEIPSPVGSGVVPPEEIENVRNFLAERKQKLESAMSAAEDVEVGDVRLEDLGGSPPPG